MSKKAKLTAESVVSILEKKQFSAPAHALLREVRNGTGYGMREERFADALVVSLWPSRGIWFAGVEVKVDRGDWLRELKDPSKSAEIQKWCDYWWIAAPEGVVVEGEIPETWGWLEISGAKSTVRKQAPKLEAQHPSQAFVAAILRRQASNADRIRGSIRRELEAELSSEPTADEAELKRQLQQEKNAHQRTKDWHKTLQERVEAFKASSGVNIDNPYDRNIGTAFALAQRMLGGSAFGNGPAFNVIADQLDDLSRQLRTVQAEAQTKPEAAE